jgi:hypothetical protein
VGGAAKCVEQWRQPPEGYSAQPNDLRCAMLVSISLMRPASSCRMMPIVPWLMSNVPWIFTNGPWVMTIVPWMVPIVPWMVPHVPWMLPIVPWMMSNAVCLLLNVPYQLCTFFMHLLLCSLYVVGKSQRMNRTINSTKRFNRPAKTQSIKHLT